MDITEFLTARYDEDEAEAQWSGPARVAWLTYRRDDGQMNYTTVAAAHGDGDPWCADGHELPQPASARIVYDPARVLADIAAKRARLYLYEEAAHRYAGLDIEIPGARDDQDRGGILGRYGMAARMIRLDAQAYADHPDFDPARRIDG